MCLMLIERLKMANIFLVSQVTDNALIHNLQLINQLEGLIVVYTDEINAGGDSYKIKENKELLTEATEEKLRLINHIEECFNLSYDVNAHQKISELKQHLYVIKESYNEDWKSSMWLSDDEVELVRKENKELSEKIIEELLSLGVKKEIIETLTNE